MEENFKVNNGKLVLDVIITQEEIDGRKFYVAQGIQVEVASQGLSLQEALENFKDAAEVVINSSEETKNRLAQEETELTVAPMLTRVLV